MNSKLHFPNSDILHQSFILSANLSNSQRGHHVIQFNSLHFQESHSLPRRNTRDSSGQNTHFTQHFDNTKQLHGIPAGGKEEDDCNWLQQQNVPFSPFLESLFFLFVCFLLSALSCSELYSDWLSCNKHPANQNTPGRSSNLEFRPPVY